MREPMPTGAQGPASRDAETWPRRERGFSTDALELLLLSLMAMAAAGLSVRSLPGIAGA